VPFHAVPFHAVPFQPMPFQAVPLNESPFHAEPLNAVTGFCSELAPACSPRSAFPHPIVASKNPKVKFPILRPQRFAGALLAANPKSFADITMRILPPVRVILNPASSNLGQDIIETLVKMLKCR
jgi:hypothetical protein